MALIECPHKLIQKIHQLGNIKNMSYVYLFVFYLKEWGWEVDRFLVRVIKQIENDLEFH